MVTLRIANAPDLEKHDGEVFCCTYTPDGAFVLSAGWDGHLRLWEASSGNHLSALKAGPKPLSACAVTPDGQCWVAGSMEGLLTFWEACSHSLLAQYVGHTRPVSAVCFSPDGQLMATASWDRNVCLRGAGRKDRDAVTFSAHSDIVAGCRFLPHVAGLLSWSHDGTLRVWDVESGEERAVLRGPGGRVTAGAVAPDGRWAASGSREGELVLWDLESGAQVEGLKLPAEVRGCFFLLDGASLLIVDAEGRLGAFSLPGLELQSQEQLGYPVQCGELVPGGTQLALGCGDGRVRLVAVEGLENSPLLVTATRSTRQVAGRWRLFGRPRTTHVFECTCPACRRPIELHEKLPSHPVPCPHCRQPLRYSAQTRVAHESAC